MQYRRPVGLGPSVNTWPRWESHRLHSTSVRTMPKLRSVSLGDVLFGDRLVETGPARARIVLGFRREKRRSATDAFVYAIFVVLVVLAREGPFRALLPGDVVLLVGESLFPFFLRS